MDTRSFSFAKLVSPPTVLAWSQAYNAGSLFVAVSLTKNPNGQGEDAPLSAVGKDLINTLEEEYFTLEEKKLASIQQAIQATSRKLEKNVTCSLVAASVVDTILYVFVYSTGTILLKRKDTLGILLSIPEHRSDEVLSASGMLQDGDSIILETAAFTHAIPHDVLRRSLTATPAETSELLAPRVLDKEENTGCAIFIGYQKPAPLGINSVPTATVPIIHHAQPDQPDKPDEPSSEHKSFLHRPSFPKMPPFFQKLPFSRSKLIILLIALVLIGILGTSIYAAVQRQRHAQSHTQFTQLYESAQKKYDDGHSLINLNKNLARENLKEAQTILQKAQSRVEKGSAEEKQWQELEDKITAVLKGVSDAMSVTPQEVDSKNSILLQYELKNTQNRVYTQSASTVYAAGPKDILALDKETEKEKTLITNDSDWEDVGGVGVYNGNVYLVDKKTNQIYKFIPSGSGYTKSTYLANASVVPLSNSQSLAIDGSIYVLTKDGSIMKFTKGKGDSFTISGLDQPLSKPTRIFTTQESDNLYVLDNGNSRLVVFDKGGKYQSQYKAGILQTAIDFDISEKDKKAYILSGKKVWEIELK